MHLARYGLSHCVWQVYSKQWPHNLHTCQGLTFRLRKKTHDRLLIMNFSKCAEAKLYQICFSYVWIVVALSTEPVQNSKGSPISFLPEYHSDSSLSISLSSYLQSTNLLLLSRCLVLPWVHMILVFLSSFLIWGPGRVTSLPPFVRIVNNPAWMHAHRWR